MPTYDDFKQCVKTQGSLDFEALDVMFLQPLKDLSNWWQQQSQSTQRYINWFTGAVGTLGVAGLTAFLKKIMESIAPGVAAAFAEALGAVIAGIFLGTVFDVMVRCGLQEVTADVPAV